MWWWRKVFLISYSLHPVDSDLQHFQLLGAQRTQPSSLIKLAWWQILRWPSSILQEKVSIVPATSAAHPALSSQYFCTQHSGPPGNPGSIFPSLRVMTSLLSSKWWKREVLAGKTEVEPDGVSLTGGKYLLCFSALKLTKQQQTSSLSSLLLSHH